MRASALSTVTFTMQIAEETEHRSVRIPKELTDERDARMGIEGLKGEQSSNAFDIFKSPAPSDRS